MSTFALEEATTMKHVYVTGATSMLGLSLARRCLAEGIRVTAIVRGDSPRKELLPCSDRIATIECDIADYSRINADSPKRESVFYHLSWNGTGHEGRNDVAVQNRNIGFTLDAMALAARFGCRAFIGAGSQAEYGLVDGVISPDSAVQPVSAYGAAKFAAGRLAELLSRQLGVRCVWPRIFSIYGPNDAPVSMVPYCIDALLRREKPSLTACGQMWDYLYCDDAADALFLLGTGKTARTVYNIGSGAARPLREYVTAIRDAIDPDLPLGFGEKEYAPNQVMHLCADIAALRDDVGFVPKTSFRDGIEKTIAWHKSRASDRADNK